MLESAFGLVSLAVLAVFVAAHNRFVRKKRAYEDLMAVDVGKCWHCGECSPKCVVKSGFWTQMKCPLCRKTTTIHYRGSTRAD